MNKSLFIFFLIFLLNNSAYSQEKIELETFYGFKKSKINDFKSFPVFFALGGRIYENYRGSISIDLIVDRSNSDFVPLFFGIRNTYLEGRRQQNISINQQVYFGKEKNKYGLGSVAAGLSTTLTYHINSSKGIILGFDYDESDVFYLKIGYKKSYYLNKPNKSVKRRRKEEMKCPD